ncbi:PIG-L deacetylase family protein [Streptomyces sp. 130]|uniref:PIG-L deacetylase family protein n=1 Tax=Streptomyces sp. 130 TaxID=2591006 RepID=UPI00163D99DC|nr:PIG-L deacetylase family protein [Streptomyces sp. 130]
MTTNDDDSEALNTGSADEAPGHEGLPEPCDGSGPPHVDVAGPLPLGGPLPPDYGHELSGLRIVVADQDAAAGGHLAAGLRERGAEWVGETTGMEDFLRMLRDHPADVHVALWHEALEPDPARRVALLDTWLREFPDTAIVLTADRLTSASTLTALRGGAAEVLRRGAQGAEVAAVVRHAYRTHAARHGGAGGERPRMLVVGAHPDDAEIGAGALIHRRVRDGWDITVLVMSRGSFGGDPDRRSQEARHAAEVLGASFDMADFPDGHITDATETVQAIEQVVARVAPDLLLVHSEHDTHQDHRAVHRAALVAGRRVPRVACYQSPSATVNFSPNRFIGVREEDVEAKLEAIRAHRSQSDTRAYLDEGLIRSTARYWGRFTGDAYAEPLEVVRYSAELGRSLV